MADDRKLSPRQREQLGNFAERVRASPHNLVSRRASAELMDRHVPEAVALARLLPSTGGRCLDVGSGGGLPGLVVAIVRPELEVHLLEATGKKADFLSDTASALGLAVTVHLGRAEELARGPLQGSFDLVTARAVARLEALLPLTVPFLAREGVLYAVKGERWAEELAEAKRALQRERATVLATPADTLHGQDDDTEATTPRVVMIGRAG